MYVLVCVYRFYITDEKLFGTSSRKLSIKERDFFGAVTSESLADYLGSI